MLVILSSRQKTNLISLQWKTDMWVRSFILDCICAFPSKIAKKNKNSLFQLEKVGKKKKVKLKRERKTHKIEMMKQEQRWRNFGYYIRENIYYSIPPSFFCASSCSLLTTLYVWSNPMIFFYLSNPFLSIASFSCVFLFYI